MDSLGQCGCIFDGDIDTRDSIFVDPRDTRLRNLRSHHWAGEGHCLDQDNSIGLGLDRGAEAEDIASPEVSRLELIRDEAKELHSLLQAELLSQLQQLCSQRAIPSDDQDIVITEMGHRLDQVVISLVGDETAHIEDDLFPRILITYGLDFIREPRVRVYTDRQEGRLILNLAQEGGLLHIHGRRP